MKTPAIDAVDISGIAGTLAISSGVYLEYGAGWSLMVAGAILCAFACLCLIARIRTRKGP